MSWREAPPGAERDREFALFAMARYPEPAELVYLAALADKKLERSGHPAYAGLGDLLRAKAAELRLDASRNWLICVGEQVPSDWENVLAPSPHAAIVIAVIGLLREGAPCAPVERAHVALLADGSEWDTYRVQLDDATATYHGDRSGTYTELTHIQVSAIAIDRGSR